MRYLTSGADYGAALEDALSSVKPGTASGSGIFSSWDAFADYLVKNQVPFALIVILVGVVLAAFLIIRRRRAKQIPDPMKAQEASTFLKVSSGILILMLMTSDLFAMYNMFSSFRLKWEQSILFSCTFALFLEGFPFALGMIDPLKNDPAQFITKRDKRYRMLSYICWTFLIVSWVLAILIRLMYTEQPAMGGFEGFWEGSYNSSHNKYSNNAYLAQVFLYVSPILTSVLAYVLSYLAFGSSCLQEAAKLLRASHARYNHAKAVYEKTNNLRLDATSTLWSSLTGTSNNVPPPEFSDFRNQSMVYIHDMLIQSCLDVYPALLKRYNYEVEAALSRYIVELSRLSSMPQRISQITVQEITESYDARMVRDVDKWEYELCEPAMCADLEALLHDAVIGAQFKALSKK